MLEEIQMYLKRFLESLRDVRNVVLYIFTLIVLAITWSGVKTVQINYNLQKQIAVLKQQNDVLSLQNQNAVLQNEYYQTDQYLDLAARQNLGLAAPGEKVILVPKNVALKYINPSLIVTAPSSNQGSTNTSSKYVRNLETWRDFLLGRKVSSD